MNLSHGRDQSLVFSNVCSLIILELVNHKKISLIKFLKTFFNYIFKKLKIFWNILFWTKKEQLKNTEQTKSHVCYYEGHQLDKNSTKEIDDFLVEKDHFEDTFFLLHHAHSDDTFELVTFLQDQILRKLNQLFHFVDLVPTHYRFLLLS